MTAVPSVDVSSAVQVLLDKAARQRFFAWCKLRAIDELYIGANTTAGRWHRSHAIRCFCMDNC